MRRRRNWPVWKKAVFLLTVIAVFVRILYIAGRGELNKEYVTSMEYDLTEFTKLPCRNIEIMFVGGRDKLDSLELIFTDLAEGEETALTLAVQREGRTLYRTGLSLTADDNWKWKRVSVNMVPEEGAEYTISLNADEESVQTPMLLVVQQGAAEIVRSCQDGMEADGTIAVNFGYLISPGYFDCAMVIFLWLLFTAAVFLFLTYFEAIADVTSGICRGLTESVPQAVLTAVLEVLAVMIIINCSGIGVQESTKIILYGISLLAIVKREEKKQYVRELADRPAKRVLLYLLYGYAAFALVGQRIWVYPLDVRIHMAGLFVFAVTICWFVPVIDSLLYGLEKAGRLVSGGGGRNWQFGLLCTVLLLLPAFCNLFANNPGMSSPDTAYTMINSAKQLYGMYDWHPAFYCMVLRAIQKVSDTTYAVIAVQYFFWAYVMNELLLYLRKRGMREGVLIGLAGFSGFNAANLLHLNTIWKDIPYTLSLLWVFVILLKLSWEPEAYRRKWYIYLEFIAAMTGVCLYRKNGMVSFAIIIIAALAVLRTNARVWIAAVLAVVSVLVIKGPVYDYFEVIDSGRHGLYIGLGQDILGAYYSGGEVSEDTLAMITEMTGGSNDGYPYTPTWSRAAYDVDVEPVEFIRLYIDTFVKNPILLTRAVIDREDLLWDIFRGKDTTIGCVNFIGTEDADTRFSWNEYYPKRRYVSLYTEMAAATDYTAATQWIDAIEWRSGLFTLLGLTALLYLIFRRGPGRYLLLLAPMAGQIMSLLLSTGWSDFRYFWPLNLLNMAWIMVVPAATAGWDEGLGEER